jgi:hypothetical protein
MERLTGERRAREAFARLARRLRRPHHDAEERLRRRRASTVSFVLVDGAERLASRSDDRVFGMAEHGQPFVSEVA